MLLTLDIETLPDQTPGARDSFIAESSLNFKAPSTLTKEQAAKDLGLTEAQEIKFTSKDAMIARWEAEMAVIKAEEVGDAAWRKTSFDGLYGSIACICYQFDDGEVFSVDCNTSGGEKTMLEHFYSHVFDMVCTEYHGGVASQNLIVCGHNVAGFDLPFLKHRSIILGVKPPVALLKAMSAKSWDGCIADTMLMWSNDPHKRGSMDRLCKVFGLEGKGDFDGSMVADTWPVDPQKVIDYCKDDVRRTRAMYKRMTFDTYAPAMELAA